MIAGALEYLPVLERSSDNCGDCTLAGNGGSTGSPQVEHGFEVSDVAVLHEVDIVVEGSRAFPVDVGMCTYRSKTIKGNVYKESHKLDIKFKLKYNDA